MQSNRLVPLLIGLIAVVGMVFYGCQEGPFGRRRVVTLAGIDAHARLDLVDDPVDSRYAVPIPGYEPSFHVMSIHVRPERALSGDASTDAAIVLRALRGGHSYTAIDGIATPASFELTATNEHGTVSEGDELRPGGPVRLRVRSNAPPSQDTIELEVNRGTAFLSGNWKVPGTHRLESLRYVA